jgi:16S rRNA (guanine527-N7)-methyltransferase
MGCQRGNQEAGLPVLEAGAAALGLSLSEMALYRFRRYLELLQAHGARMNLTSVRDAEGVQRRHFVESLALGVALRDAGRLHGRERVIDLGSGAGFPGVPLAIVWPGLRLTLLEATQKKARFLETLVEELALPGACVVAQRAEDAAHDRLLRERFDLALARAVAPLPALAELGLPFVRTGGALAAVKGSRLDDELCEARQAIERCGGGTVRVLPLPGREAAMPLRVALIAKIRRTPPGLPRRAGLPQHEPLR